MAFVFYLSLSPSLPQKNVLSWWPEHDIIYSYAPRLRAVFHSVHPILRQYDTSAPILTHDIKSFLQSPTAAATMLGAKSRSDRKHLIEMIVHYQLTHWLIKVFQLDPALAFKQTKPGSSLQDSLQLMTGLGFLVQHQPPPFLPLNASEVLLELHKPENISLWDPSDTMTAFWDISGQVTFSITQKLFSRKTADPLQLLKWLRKILHYRTEFLFDHPALEASHGVGGKISQQLYTMLETVLLLFLRNTDIEAVQISMSCFKYLVSEAELVSSPAEPVGVPYAPNLRAYKMLEEASNTPHIGRVAQQRKIRIILRQLVHTPGSALAWEDTYSSWRVSKSLLVNYQRHHRHESGPPDLPHRGLGESLHRSVIKRVGDFTAPRGSTRLHEPQLTEDNLQDTLTSWTNMTGFLCSLAGVSTKPSTGFPHLTIHQPGANSSPPPSTIGTLPFNASTGSLDNDNSAFISRPKRSSSCHGSRPKSVITPVPSQRSGIQDSSWSSSSRESIASAEEIAGGRGTSQTESFITELISLLSCDNEATGMNVREGAKKMIYEDLSSMVYPSLFQCLQQELGKIVRPDSQFPDIGDTNTVFVDQVVSISQRVLDGRSEGGLGRLVHVKLDELLLSLVR